MREQINIFIAEDKATEAKQLKNGLEKYNYNVLPIAKSYKEACRIIEEYEPDIAILDIELNDEYDGKDLYGGISIAEYIRDNNYIPFIFLTDTFENEGLTQRAIKTRPSNYLEKPFSTTSLIRSIIIAINNYSVAQTQEAIGENNNFNFKPKSVLWLPNNNGELQKIPVEKIVYVETANEITKIYTKTIHTNSKTEKYQKICSLKCLLKELPLLIQISGNKAVNPVCVRSVSLRESAIYLDEPYREITLTATEHYIKAVKKSLEIS